MRVVRTDNFGGDYPIERFVTDSLSIEEANKEAKRLNAIGDINSLDYYIVTDDTYILSKGFEE